MFIIKTNLFKNKRSIKYRMVFRRVPGLCPTASCKLSDGRSCSPPRRYYHKLSSRLPEKHVLIRLVYTR